MKRQKIIVILGPTATGKSSLAVEVAEEFGGEIISADSVQVYRYMDIGTAKPPPEVRERIPHHLIDVVDPDEGFSAGLFRKLAEEAIAEIGKEGRMPIVAGGTGLYIKALISGLIEGVEGDEVIRRRLSEEARAPGGGERLYLRLREVDPASAERIHPHDIYRVIRALEIYEVLGLPPSRVRGAHRFSKSPYDVLKIGLIKEREELYKGIDRRVDMMVKEGLREETLRLLSMGYGPELRSMQSIGYRQMVRHIRGEYDLEEAIRLIKRDTRRLAKRQITWFKPDREIRWYRYPEQRDEILRLIRSFWERGKR